MTESTVSTPVPFPLFSTLLLGSADTLTSPLGFVPSYFGENAQDQTPSRGTTVYAISHTDNAQTQIIYRWENLRPFAGGTSEPIYSVAQDGVNEALRCIVEKAIKGWTLDPDLEGREIIVPVDTVQYGIVTFNVRPTVILLPADSS